MTPLAGVGSTSSQTALTAEIRGSLQSTEKQPLSLGLGCTLANSVYSFVPHDSKPHDLVQKKSPSKTQTFGGMVVWRE